MEPQKFNEVLEEMQAQCRTLLIKKEEEYSDGMDRLIQFKQAAALRNVSPLEACSGMMVKHTTKLYSMISAEDKGKIHGRDAWEEVLNDHSNYLTLLKAVLIDEGMI